MSNRQTEVVANSTRKTRILASLMRLVNDLTGINPENIDVHAKFLEAGIDSLTLIQATQLVKEQYNVKLSVVQLVEQLNNIDSLATYIDTELPADPIAEVVKSEPALDAAPQPVVPTAPLAEIARPAVPNSPLLSSPPPSSSFTPPGQFSTPATDQIMSQQLHILAQQLEIMRAAYQNGGATDPQAAQSEPASPVIERESSVSPAPVHASFIQSQPTFVPYQPLEPGPTDGLTEKQRRHLDDLIARHNFRTRESKRLTQEYRRHLADSRTSLGFRLLWKELIYPIIGDRSSGSKIWDVDGNEYVDISMGFGVHLFGHSPDFIYEAIKQEIDRKGLQLGTQIFLAGKVARLISELTGQERVNFCNSGTEAVMGALRIARTVTRRSRVAIFAGAYHGWWDGTLAKVVAVNGEQRTMPVGPGISAKAVEDLVVLGWDSPDSIEYLNKHAHELAAVMVEPVQSRRPDIQPREFLHELRQLTARTGTALIFDEMITGFRIHRGGAQAWFGVEADIATYGKVIGGGLPIGVIAGKAAFMNAFDGGMWNYGDGSYPESEKTLFAGTFFKHPLAIAAARVLLERLRDNPSLLPDLNDHTARLVAMLNQYFEAAEVPINVVNFCSLFRFILAPELKYVDLFFYHMLDRGVFVWEGRTCFLSTAHTEDDFSSVVRAVAGSVDQMRAGGFWPEPPRKTNSRTFPASVGAVPVEHADVRSIPLTDAQRQLWITAQIGPDASRAYNESVTLRMRGRFDPQSMRRALEQLIERHELLRATFSSDGEYQLIHPAMSIDIPLVDFSHLQENAREAEAQAWITREIGEPFDLERGPLVRFTIVKMDEDLHLLIFNAHHLIIDGQSWGVLLKDLEELYSAAHRGVALQLRPPRGFSYYVERLHQFQRHSNAHTSEEYWLKLFRDCVPVLRLPTDRPRPPVQTYNGKRLLIATDASLFEKAKTIGAEQGSTLYMTLLAAYSALLHRLSGQQKIIVGIPAAGQLAIGCKNSVGYCVNLMPLLSDAGDNPTFADYLATVKRSLMESLEHQHYSFSRLLRRLDIPWDASRSPLFTTIFNIDRIDPAAKFSDLELEVITDSTDWARYDLRMNLIESDKLLLECTFNTDLFDESTIRRWMGYFQTLLSAVCDDPTLRVRNLSLVTEDEARQLLVTWNDTAADDLPTEEFHRLFEAQADQTPESVAVICEDERLSYRDLNVMSNRLARHLRRRGVGPETTVALYCERSAEMIVALLAVIKAGGAYVPLDPSYPRERLRFMLADCAARIVVTHEQQRTVFEDCGSEVICLSSNRNEWLEESGENLEAGAAASNLAYIIYTSGSTGRPKGVCIEHRQLLNYVRGVSHSLSLPKGGNFATVSTFAADLGYTMIFPALCGGTLHVITEDKLVNPDALAEYFELHKIDCLKVVPSHLEALLMARHPEQVLPRLRLILGGEVAQPGLLARLGELEAACEVFNHYGPTEATVGSLTFHVPKERLQVPAAEAAALPLGRPIANTRVYVLDAHGQPVPPGIYGELYVGGKGVARGYHNQPELTAERFVPDPFSGEPGARLYRTGDVGRHLPNGEIEFAGRTDNQVKIAGQRIEPGEIEVALGEHPAVRTAIVVTRDHLPGERGLVAYVVTQLETPVSISGLRQHLRQRLPQYMQPAAFVMLDKMPLTTNGKIDRHALPGPDATRPEMDQAYEQPRTVVEERLAQVWSEVLRLKHLGVHDNFFELGGSSLLGTKMTARVRERFQVQLTLRNLFESPTIAELSALIVARQSTTEVVCPEPVAAPRMRVDQLLSSVDHLPEAEVESLLEELLAEEKAM